MRTRTASVLALLAAAPVLFAHPGPHEVGFVAGASHPVHGLDHILAMVAVGLLGVRCATKGSKHALWQVPASFMGAMVVGGLLAVAGVPMPGAEWGIAFSVLVFGVLIALSSAPRTWIACTVAGAFALLHGHAHVAEMEGSSLAAYMGGFLLVTAVLHASGVAAGWYVAKTLSQGVVRTAGIGVALASIALFVSLV
jgi:urease accessory protein